MKTKQQLSAYTLPECCTDLRDVQCGIDEIREAIKLRESRNERVPIYFYGRLRAMESKLRQLGGKVEPLVAQFQGYPGAWVCEHDRNENVYRVRTAYDETICQSPQLDEAADPARVPANFQAIAAAPEMWNLLRELYEQLETHRPRFYKREHYLQFRQIFDKTQR